MTMKTHTAFRYGIMIPVTIVLLLSCGGGSGRNGNAEETPKEITGPRVVYMTDQGLKIVSKEEYVALVDSVFRADHSAISYACYASIFCRDKDYDRALRYTDTALALITPPGRRDVFSIAHFVRSSCYEEMGQVDKAAEELKTIIAYGPDDSADGAGEALCRLYYHRGRYREALAALPDSLTPEGRTYLQMCREKLDSCERAGGYEQDLRVINNQ